MAKPSEDERKRLTQNWKQSERAAIQAALPLSREGLIELRSYLSREFDQGQVCDHSYRLTSQWLDGHAKPHAAVLGVFLDLGGGCDCEVLANVQPAEIFGNLRAPVSVPKSQGMTKPPHSAALYEDQAIVIEPERPWRIVETRPYALLTLRLGKGTTGPTLSLLELHDSSPDLEAWCRARWESLHLRRWQHLRRESNSDAQERAIAEWASFGYQATPPTLFHAGCFKGLTITISSPRRTDAYQWWMLKLPGDGRVLELESEMSRLQNDRRAVHNLIASASVRNSPA